MTSTFREATQADAAELAALHNAVVDDLTSRFGKGHWSYQASERGVLYDLKIGRVWVETDTSGVIGTFKLGTRKPWAIDVSYFTPVTRPLYLQSMAVRPELQRRGVGRRLLEHAIEVAKSWPCDAIRLDAYDADAGAGGFYAKCGFSEVGRANYRGTACLFRDGVVDTSVRGATGIAAPRLHQLVCLTVSRCTSRRWLATTDGPLTGETEVWSNGRVWDRSRTAPTCGLLRRLLSPPARR